MRISSSYAFESAQSNLQKRQQQLSTAQEQLTSGKRVMRPSDDPAAAAQAERALAALSRSQSQQRALGASKDAMQLAESALGNAGELLQQVREQLVAAGNGSYGDRDRRTMALAIRSLRDDLFTVANRSDGAGRYLFGGQGSDIAPFADNPGGVTYTAASGALEAAAGEASPLSSDGQYAWLQAADPANPGATLSLFDVLDRVADELLIAGRSSAQVAQTVASGLRDIDASDNHLAAFRARAGESLNRIDGISERLSQAALDAQRQRSEAEDLDMLEAISDFQNKQTGYDAALKTYSLVQKMSLFDYIR